LQPLFVNSSKLLVDSSVVLMDLTMFPTQKILLGFIGVRQDLAGVIHFLVCVM